MSLDIDLAHATTGVVYSCNITHNLQAMARKAGIHYVLWEPEKCGIEKAIDMIGPLTIGVGMLAANKAKFVAFEPDCGWGTWEGLLMFCINLLQACRDNPYASVQVSK